ncbi:hypothetical protein [Vulgatibacter sp.]|uniref:hypothetical protein n=1 Tax=Vulgatibacter sp. TaxID=1971226 RepID=UPI0035689970
MERQFLCYLHGTDEAEFLRRIEAIEPGLVVLPGKYADTGDASALLADPGAHAFRPAVRSVRRLYLAHRAHSRQLVLHQQGEGPNRGLHALDELRSEVMQLELPAPAHGRLAPARLSASVLAFEDYERIRKGAAFGRWVGRVLRSLEAALPRSSVEFVHVAPGAVAFAAGGGQLTYLEEHVLPAPDGRRRQVPLERIRG